MSESRGGESRSYSSYTPSYKNYGGSKNDGESKDIGHIRKEVMQELYYELYGEIKEEVRVELEKEKPEIVRELRDELKERLKTDLRRSFMQGRGEDR